MVTHDVDWIGEKVPFRHFVDEAVELFLAPVAAVDLDADVSANGVLEALAQVGHAGERVVVDRASRWGLSSATSSADRRLPSMNAAVERISRIDAAVAEGLPSTRLLRAVSHSACNPRRRFSTAATFISSERLPLTRTAVRL